MIDQKTIKEFYNIARNHAINRHRDTQFIPQEFLRNFIIKRRRSLDKKEEMQLIELTIMIYEELITKEKSVYTLNNLWFCSVFSTIYSIFLKGGNGGREWDLQESTKGTERKKSKVINSFIKLISKETETSFKRFLLEQCGIYDGDYTFDFFEHKDRGLPMPFDNIKILKKETRKIETNVLWFKIKKKRTVLVPKTKEEIIAEIQTFSRQ